MNASAVAARVGMVHGGISPGTPGGGVWDTGLPMDLLYVRRMFLHYGRAGIDVAADRDELPCKGMDVRL